MADEENTDNLEDLDENIEDADESNDAVSAAKIEVYKAIAKKKYIEARKELAAAKKAEIELARLERQEKSELARDLHHRRYHFNEVVNSTSVEKCMTQLTEWSRNYPKSDIEIVFNSPGGAIISGMALFDFIGSLRRAGHFITTTTYGYAASMAGILLQAGDVRQMGKEAWILIHEASFMTAGSTGQVEDTVEWVKRIQERILDIFAERCKNANPETATHKLTRAALKRRWRRKDWWISSNEALKFGLIDVVL
ncbi:MAG: ATP-dependent Clp protease proteolytic subunit [Nitrososphaerales archaeon]